jgi:hypothetical protein
MFKQILSGVIGEKILAYFNEYYWKFYKNYYRPFSGKTEAKRVLRLIKNRKITRIMVVFDCKDSGSGYGDFLLVAMTARYFTLKGMPVNFIIVNSEYGEGWDWLNSNQKRKVIDDFLFIARALLKPLYRTIELLSWDQLQTRLTDGTSLGSDIIFHDKVISRTRTYDCSHALNSQLVLKSDRKFMENFLLSDKGFYEHIEVERPTMPYITWHCRKLMDKGSKYRNTTDEEFLKVSKELKSIYPNHELMIISDEYGCNYFRDLAHKFGVKVIFSKDFCHGDSYIGDGWLVVNSSYHFALRGGGIIQFAFYSKVPHEINYHLSNTHHWGKGKFGPWSSKKQLCRDIEFSLELFLPTGKIEIG